FRFSGSLLPLLTLSEDDAVGDVIRSLRRMSALEGHLLIPLCPNRKVCGQCRSFGNGHCLSGRLFSCGSSCVLFGGGSADADESYEPLPALKRRLWRLLKAGNKLLRFTTQSE
ncbi:MAG: hypothetical protein ACI3ZN_10230, partial [Candidatus Cryptobacteroides sp.]